MFSALGLLVACGAFSPAVGAWTASNIEMGADTCNAEGEAPDADDLSFSLAIDDETGVITLGFGAGDNAFTTDCTLNDKALTCGLDEVLDLGDGRVFTVEFDLTGTFQNDELLRATLSGGVECVGDACTSTDECAYTATFDADFAG